jgi:SAM-dependent methyltransferase
MSLGVRFAHLPRWLARRIYPVLRYTNLMRAVEMRHLAPWVRRIEGWQVLDVGCGYGFYSLDFARRGGNLIGCDLSLPALEASHQTGQGLGLDGRTAYMVADGSMLPLASNAFDLTFCNCVLEHVADDHQALLEMYLTVDNAEHHLWLGFLERLAPGTKKRLLRSEVAGAATVRRGLDDYLAGIYDVRRRYRRGELEATLQGLGFEVLDRRAYVSLLGAAHYEVFRLTRGVDPRRGLSRLVHMITSLILYPLVVVVDSFQRKQGYGLMFTARKEPETCNTQAGADSTQHG